MEAPRHSTAGPELVSTSTGGGVSGGGGGERVSTGGALWLLPAISSGLKSGLCPSLLLMAQRQLELTDDGSTRFASSGMAFSQPMADWLDIAFLVCLQCSQTFYQE